MKKLTAYYLILLYACSIAKPVSIWFADVMAHSYFGHRHTSVVHHEGGRDHVHYQIGKAAKDDAPEQKTATPKSNEDVTVAAFVESLLRHDGFVDTKQYIPQAVQLSTLSLAVHPPPPWVVLS